MHPIDAIRPVVIAAVAFFATAIAVTIAVRIAPQVIAFVWENWN